VSRATLHFDASNAAGIPAHLLSPEKGDGLKSLPVFVIEMTGTSIFIVDPVAEGGGPAEWRRARKPNPKVIQLRREAVESVVYVE
jgi:hypothetical protein